MTPLTRCSYIFIRCTRNGAGQDAESHKTLAFEDADTSHEEELEQPKEGLDMNVRTMTATNAASGTFGLGLDQFELPKASIAKLARNEVRCHLY